MAPNQGEQALLPQHVPRNDIARRAIGAEERREPFVQRDVNSVGWESQADAYVDFPAPTGPSTRWTLGM